MRSFILSRVLRTFITILVVLTFVFFLVRLSGDPVRLMLPESATEADVQAMRDTLGLNAPFLQQYVEFIWSALRGDFGDSIRQARPALGIVLERLPETLKLAIPGFALGFIVALVLAVVSEWTNSQRVRTVFLWLATARQTIPPYLFALIMILIFSVQLGMLPSMGSSSFQHFIIPVLTIATLEVALYLRLFYQSFNESRTSDFVRTARAKGASQGRVVLKHMLPNAMLPIVTVAGLNLGILVGGTVVLEMIFNWPGIGRLIVQDGVLQRDYPIVQAGLFVVALFFILINLFVDILYTILDPRIKLLKGA